MFALIKSEIKYFKIPLGIMIFLPLIFTVYAFNNILFFQNIYFLEKYFWTMFVGIGTYAFIFIIWTLRAKENRERLHYFTPIPQSKISLARWFFGVAPILLVILYLEFINQFIPSEQIVFADRISVQLGLFFIFLTSFDCILNLDPFLDGKKTHYKSLAQVSVALVLALSSIIVIYLVTEYVNEGFDKLYFHSWWIIIFCFSTFIHFRRKTFA